MRSDREEGDDRQRRHHRQDGQAPQPSRATARADGAATVAVLDVGVGGAAAEAVLPAKRNGYLSWLGSRHPRG